MTAPMIFVSLTRPALHCWPKAPASRAYLRDPHRHIFHIMAETTVEHDDREIEFHDLVDQTAEVFDRLIGGSKADAGSASCETLARCIAQELSKLHKRYFSVTVSEDGECGATVEQLFDAGG